MYTRCFRKRLHLINPRAIRERKKIVQQLFFVAIKFSLKLKLKFRFNSANVRTKYGIFGYIFTKIARLTLAANNFYSRRTYVPKKCGYVCNNFRKKFPSKNFQQYLFFLMQKELSFFFPFLQFNCFFNFEWFS